MLYPKVEPEYAEFVAPPILIGSPEWRDLHILGIAAMLFDVPGVDQDRHTEIATVLFDGLDDWGTWEAVALRQAVVRTIGR